MLEHAFLYGFVVIRYDHKVGVNSGCSDFERQIDGLLGRIRTRTGDNGQSSVNEFNCLGDKLDVLGFCQAGGLARCSGDYQPIRSLIDMKIDQALEGRVIDPIIRVKWGRKSDQGTLEHSLSSP